jgi:hypothetical protein
MDTRSPWPDRRQPSSTPPAVGLAAVVHRRPKRCPTRCAAVLEIPDECRRIALLQTGAAATLSVLPPVPEPPLQGLDADRVDPSGEAYALFHTPDGSLGIAVPGCRSRWPAWAVPCGIDSSRRMVRRDRSAVGRDRAGRRAEGARRLRSLRSR